MNELDMIVAINALHRVMDEYRGCQAGHTEVCCNLWDKEEHYSQNECLFDVVKDALELVDPDYDFKNYTVVTKIVTDQSLDT